MAMNRHYLGCVVGTLFGIVVGGVAVVCRTGRTPLCGVQSVEANRLRLQAENLRLHFIMEETSVDDRLASVTRRIAGLAGSGGVVHEYVDALSGIESWLDLVSDDEIATRLDRPLRDLFLWKKGLNDFSSVSEFETFANVSLDIVVALGMRDICKGDFDYAAAREDLAYKTLKEYAEKFSAEGRAELLKCVEVQLSRWIEHIESFRGFTHKLAKYHLFMNTDFANALRPGTGLSRNRSLRLARSAANGLIHCGYTPKWLKEFEP